MLNLIPTPYRILAGLAVLLIACGSAYFAGWSGQHDLLVTYRAQVAQAAAAQAAQSHQKDLENEQQTKTVADAYRADADRLRTNLERLRKQSPTGGRAVSPFAIRTKSPDAAPGEQRGACEGSEFYANALSDALMLKDWQEWAIRQRLPVE